MPTDKIIFWEQGDFFHFLLANSLQTKINAELYAVFGQGGTIRFTALSDTPDQLTANTIPLVNDAATAVQLVTLASNSALDPALQDTITFSFNQTGKLIISTSFTRVSDDLTPTLGGPLFANNNPIAKVAI